MSFFNRCVNSIAAATDMLIKTDLHIKTKVTSLWVLSELSANLKQHMACACKTRKYGTVMYMQTRHRLNLSIWYRENDMLPSTDALWRHWKRSCWVIQMWNQLEHNNMEVMPVADYGWKIAYGKLAIDWDAIENTRAIQRRVGMLTKGCKCGTGCKTL